MERSTVSVVLATRNRRARLRETLESLLADVAVDEVVVVADGTSEMLEGFAAGDSRLCVLAVADRGRAAARQLGVEAATGEVVVMLDDDVVAAPGLIFGHARAHAGEDNLVVVGYMPIRLPSRRRPGDASTFLYAKNYEGSCLACDRNPSLVLKGLWGGNVSLARRDAVRAGMDTSFTHHEDRDFGLRCLKAGLRGRFDRSLRAEHVHTRTLESLQRCARGQGAGRVEIHRVHADVLPPPDEPHFSRGLPAPLSAIVLACRHPRVGSLCAGVLARAAALAGRLRLRRIETNAVKLLRRIELQRGAVRALRARP